ncbi:hypothetical protein HELRODRAFT_171470 [Helobdella robusta]|uniref:Uncharacterized protein n=1 Tax=Helobdella robusta TaxID=6412 RepID=T1F4B9_HELRO|nr:hypothetical protein HELRODRAFT_171470 [Helobdella robusta]ESO05797.1 hypothetical protein HELRODRAFT_171470 [Helobdella robusta]
MSNAQTAGIKVSFQALLKRCSTLLLNEFYKKMSLGIRSKLCDLNGHVGEKTDDFDNVHGGFGYGERDENGNRILEFAKSHGFCLLNTYFKKKLEHLITYKSGPSATQIDFFTVKQQHRRLFKNVKVIPGESCGLITETKTWFIRIFYINCKKCGRYLRYLQNRNRSYTLKKELENCILF